MWKVSARILSIKAIAARKVVKQYSASLVVIVSELLLFVLPIQNRRMYWRDEWIRGGLVRISNKITIGSKSSAEAALESVTDSHCMQWMDLTRQSSLSVGVLFKPIFANSNTFEWNGLWRGMYLGRQWWDREDASNQDVPLLSIEYVERVSYKSNHPFEHLHHVSQISYK